MCRVGVFCRVGRVVLGRCWVIFYVGMLGVVVICLFLIGLEFVSCDV